MSGSSGVRGRDGLTEFQQQVLEWIADGCVAHDRDGDSRFKRSARALADRGLVRVTRRGGAWRATLTDRGRAQVHHARWERAIATARLRYLETRRGDLLLDEVRRWGEARVIRSYCEALRRAHGDVAYAWIGWARDYAERIDPLRRTDLAVPDLPEPSLDELAPFLVAGYRDV